MPKAQKTESGMWRCRAFYQDADGRHQKSFTAPTKKEAEFLAAEFSMLNKKSRNNSDIELADALQRYIASKSSVLSPSTLRSYEIMSQNCFGDLLKCRLSNINSEKLQSHFNTLTAKYSAKYIKNIYSLFSATLKFFKTDVPEISLAAAKHTEILVPTLSEVKQIIKILDQAPEIRCQILLAVMCSLRESEIYALTPESVNGNIINVNGAYVRSKDGYVLKKTNKTYESTRTVLMPETLVTFMQDAVGNTSPGERIFKGSPNTLLSNFKSLLKRNGMKPYTVHSMRHAFAALMHLQGVPDQYIMRLGGWKTPNVLKSVYQYAFDDEVKKINEAANQFMDSLTSDNK